jgi:hypothetical protein
MPATDDLVTLLNHLRTNSSLISRYSANPSTAVADYDLTAHERDAVVTRDLDDFVALGVVSSIQELPPVMRGEVTVIPGSSLARAIERLRRSVGRLVRIGRGPQGPDIPRPRPNPPGPRG